MSADVAISRNEKKRDALMDEARLAYRDVVLGGKFANDEALAALDLVTLRTAVDRLETCKRRMIELRREYEALAALQ